MLQIIYNVLKKIPIFEHLDFERHRRVIEQIQLMYFPAGYVIFREGDTPNNLYILKNGEVEIFRERAGKIESISLLRDGDFFGEMALIEGIGRTASVRALTDVEVFLLDEKIFRRLASEMPELDDQLIGEYLRRKQENITVKV